MGMGIREQIVAEWRKQGLTLRELLARGGLQISESNLYRKLVRAQRGRRLSTLSVEEAQALAAALGCRLVVAQIPVGEPVRRVRRVPRQRRLSVRAPDSSAVAA